MKGSLNHLAACMLGLSAVTADAQVAVGIDPAETWLGYMNVFQLPANGGGYVFGSGWGTADLRAVFSDGALTLSPNTIGDPNDFWYIGGGAPGNPGNKIMGANMYVQKTGVLSGTSVTFSGTVLSNTLTGSHQAVAFIKDFAPDYSSFNTITVPLAPGPFSITLNTDPGAGRHVQYGFETTGVNVWQTDVAPFGSVVVATLAPKPVDPVVTIDPLAPWKGYRNVFELPEPIADGSPRPDLGGPLPPANLRAEFSGDTIVFSPNTVVTENGLDDDDWYLGDGSGDGNKTTECNFYVEFPAGAVVGKTVVFSGEVVANTLTSAHSVTAFIREFNADFSAVLREAEAPVVNGIFSISMEVGDDPSHPVQYGLQMVGPNVWPERAAEFGSIRIVAANPVEDAFSSWIATFDFSAFTDPDLSPGGDADGDGTSNFDEFALDGQPADPSTQGRLRARLVEIDTQTALVLTLAVRGDPEFTGNPAKSAVSGGVAYRIEGSNDLLAFDQEVTEVVPPVAAGMPDPSPGWSYRSFRLAGSIGGPASRGPSGFLRAATSPAP